MIPYRKTAIGQDEPAAGVDKQVAHSLITFMLAMLK
jgi:hypothetical protein